jgi:hypothetical protein
MPTLLLALIVTFQSRQGLVPDALIVGRAICAGTSWLLTETPALVEVSPASRTVVVHPVRGLEASDNVWGLACLGDNSLWTLASPRALVRLDRWGTVQERAAVDLPSIGLFGAGDRLLVQQLPIAPGAPLLLSTLPHRPRTIRTWPGLVARTGSSRERQIARNLVNCGVGIGQIVPCWLVEEASVSVSDGTTVRLLRPPLLKVPATDSAAPIWDFALIGPDRYWLLATTTVGGRRLGGRLFHSNASDRLVGDTDVLSLRPPARLIVSASWSSCLVVTVDGGLLQVEARR